MPIKFDTDKRGFHLVDPTQEELDAIQKIAVDYITMALGKMAALSFMKTLSETGELSEELDKLRIEESTIRH